MTVTYIYHSCFVVEFSGFSVIFDFYKDVPREDGSFWVKDYLLNKPEDLYVLSTHSHTDHFNPEVFTWRERKKNIQYVFSQDILDNGFATSKDAHYLKKGDIFQDDFLKIQAFGSTDIGGSFLLTVGDTHLFHAGDLNNWHWNEEVDVKEALIYENNFLCELELLAENVEQLHLAMFPVDPRLGADYMRGPEQFVSRIKTDYFLPMHFGDKYDKANAFKDVAERHRCKVPKVNHVGQSFTI